MTSMIYYLCFFKFLQVSLDDEILNIILFCILLFGA